MTPTLPDQGLDDHYRFLQGALSALSPAHRVAFAASCAQVLTPNYWTFAKEVGWGNPEVLEQCVGAAWECASAGVPRAVTVPELLRQCKAVAPDTEQFEQASTSAALNAVSAAVAALSACLNSSIQHATDAATACIDTVWGYVQLRDDLDPNDAQLEATILRDPVMTQELARQRHVLEDLRRLPEIDSSSVERLRRSSPPLKVSFD